MSEKLEGEGFSDSSSKDNVRVVVASSVEGNETAEQALRPPILAEAKTDPDGTQRSIEISPLFGETRQECKARIEILFKRLVERAANKGGIKYHMALRCGLLMAVI